MEFPPPYIHKFALITQRIFGDKYYLSFIQELLGNISLSALFQFPF